MAPVILTVAQAKSLKLGPLSSCVMAGALADAPPQTVYADIGINMKDLDGVTLTSAGDFSIQHSICAVDFVNSIELTDAYANLNGIAHLGDAVAAGAAGDSDSPAFKSSFGQVATDLSNAGCSYDCIMASRSAATSGGNIGGVVALKISDFTTAQGDGANNYVMYIDHAASTAVSSAVTGMRDDQGTGGHSTRKALRTSWDSLVAQLNTEGLIDSGVTTVDNMADSDFMTVNGVETGVINGNKMISFSFEVYSGEFKTTGIAVNDEYLYYELSPATDNTLRMDLLTMPGNVQLGSVQAQIGGSFVATTLATHTGTTDNTSYAATWDNTYATDMSLMWASNDANKPSLSNVSFTDAAISGIVLQVVNKAGTSFEPRPGPAAFLDEVKSHVLKEINNGNFNGVIGASADALNLSVTLPIQGQNGGSDSVTLSKDFVQILKFRTQSEAGNYAEDQKWVTFNTANHADGAYTQTIAADTSA